jgi:hypothetical protein
MIGFYFIQDKYRYSFSHIEKKEKELEIINQENESLLTEKKNDISIKIICKKILNYIF